jgi:hypothetical protein
MNRPWLTALVTVVPALLLLAWGWQLLRRASRSADWPLAPGTIRESRVVRQGNARSPRVRFDYVAAARPQVGNRLWVGPRSIAVTGHWADRVAERYPVGTEVRVAVDPAHPDYAVIEPGLKLVHWLPFLVGVAMLAGGVIAVVVGA